MSPEINASPGSREYPGRDVYKRQDIGYEKALDSQAKGQIKILSHAKVRNGDLFYDHKEQIR